MNLSASSLNPLHPWLFSSFVTTVVGFPNIEILNQVQYLKKTSCFFEVNEKKHSFFSSYHFLFAVHGRIILGGVAYLQGLRFPPLFFILFHPLHPLYPWLFLFSASNGAIFAVALVRVGCLLPRPAAGRAVAIAEP